MIDSVSSREATAAYCGLQLEQIGGELETAPALFSLREQILLYFCARQLPLVAGHFIFSERAYRTYKNSYVFVTLMRDPVPRLLSSYAYAKSRNPMSSNFSEFLNSDLAWQNATMLLRYFAGVPRIERSYGTRYLEIAKENARKFDLIGTMEEMDSFVSKLSELLKIRLYLPHDNKTLSKKPSLSSADSKKVDELCAFDSEIFWFAKGNS